MRQQCRPDRFSPPPQNGLGTRLSRGVDTNLRRSSAVARAIARVAKCTDEIRRGDAKAMRREPRGGARRRTSQEI